MLECNLWYLTYKHTGKHHLHSREKKQKSDSETTKCLKLKYKEFWSSCCHDAQGCKGKCACTEWNDSDFNKKE